jgi:hypothetical protein
MMGSRVLTMIPLNKGDYMSRLGKLRLIVAKFFGVTVTSLTDIQEKVLDKARLIDKEIDFILKGWIIYPPSDDHFTIVDRNGHVSNKIVIHDIIDAILMFVPRAHDIDRISLTMLAIMVGADMSSSAYIGKIPYDVEVNVMDGEWVSPFYQGLTS